MTPLVPSNLTHSVILWSRMYPRGQGQLFGLAPPRTLFRIALSPSWTWCLPGTLEDAVISTCCLFCDEIPAKKRTARENWYAGGKGLGPQLCLNKWQQATWVAFRFLKRFQAALNTINNCHWGRQTYFSFLLRYCRCYSVFCGGKKNVSWSNWKVPISEMQRAKL